MAEKILAVDFGLRKVGLAYFDGFLIEPLTVLRGKTDQQLIEKIVSLAARLEVKKIIFGLPESGSFLVKARTFLTRLKTVTDLEISESREILTTREALARMREVGIGRRKLAAKEDAVAAAILLEDYLAGLTDV